MFEVPYDYAAQRWDRYDRFYWRDANITHFATGEAIVERSPGPEQRNSWNLGGIQLTATHEFSTYVYEDRECTQRVPDAWFTPAGSDHIGVQNVAIDWEQGVVVRLANQDYRRIPNGLRWAKMYWPRDGVPPVTNTPIQMSTPNALRKNPGLRAKLRDVKTTLVASTLIRGADRRIPSVTVEPQFVDLSIEEILQVLSRLDVGEETMWHYPREVVEVPCLYVPKMTQEEWNSHNGNRFNDLISARRIG